MDPVRRILFITEDGTDSQNLREFIKGEDFQVEIDHVESYRTANEYER
ncbi:MAG: hypothetical protein P8Y37_04800 [Anaerolineales bacterium]